MIDKKLSPTRALLLYVVSVLFFYVLIKGGEQLLNSILPYVLH